MAKKKNQDFFFEENEGAIYAKDVVRRKLTILNEGEEVPKGFVVTDEEDFRAALDRNWEVVTTEAAKPEEGKTVAETFPEGEKTEKLNFKPAVEQSEDPLEFNTVDAGNFRTVSLKNDGDSFTGKFVRHWLGEEDGGSDHFSALEFREHKTGDKCVLPDNYQLDQFFTKLEDEKGNKYDIEKTVFRITRIETKKIEGGRTVGVFRIEAAIQK